MARAVGGLLLLWGQQGGKSGVLRRSTCRSRPVHASTRPLAVLAGSRPVLGQQTPFSFLCLFQVPFAPSGRLPLSWVKGLLGG